LIAKPLTDLTSKRVSERIPFGETERKAFNAMTDLLCKAAVEPLEIIDMSNTFNIFVDTSEYCCGGCLLQISKAIIDKEAYACLSVGST